MFFNILNLEEFCKNGSILMVLIVNDEMRVGVF